MTLPINRVEMNDTKIGFITSGIPYQYVKEAMSGGLCSETWHGASSAQEND